jgi:hypothetical protein
LLTAKAIDDLGAASASEPVSILVGELPPLVRIIAIDSLASERVPTNGTNTATFKIYRTGPTNLDLTVFYSVHGTASNGVDYVAIGSPATIPAGRHSARVVIVPIDDDLEEGSETVVLKLEPDPTLGPVAHYEIGRPDKAAAIIVDNDLFRPTCQRLPDGSFHLCVDKPDGSALPFVWKFPKTFPPGCRCAPMWSPMARFGLWTLKRCNTVIASIGSSPSQTTFRRSDLTPGCGAHGHDVLHPVIHKAALAGKVCSSHLFEATRRDRWERGIYSAAAATLPSRASPCCRCWWELKPASVSGWEALTGLRRGNLLSCDWAALGTARLTRGLARQGERKKPSVETLGTNAPAAESRQGRQKHVIAARFCRPFGTWLAFGLESQR